MCTNMNEYQGHYAKWIKPDTERKYCTVMESKNAKFIETEQWLPGAAGNGGWRVDLS